MRSVRPVRSLLQGTGALRSYVGYRRDYKNTTDTTVDYVYGHASVMAALKANKRSLLEKVYFQYNKEDKKESPMVESIREMCKTKNIPTIVTDKGALNNLTGDRPHQGVVLHASYLSPTHMTHLDPVHTPEHQRPPVWIALDEVQDPNNLGSILRTAHFLGMEGVLLCSKNSAPLNGTVSKVSAGAMELMPIHATSSLVRCLKTSKENGWHVMGALHKQLMDPHHTMAQQPILLVLGNEATGLRTNIKYLCDSFVTIPGSTGRPSYQGSVDSLNVGVAAGVLMSSLLMRS
ncbi:Alpha/beta knot methyltransferase [Spinellus fusiger]|nr:Alpha/beta knot methyltransferase [Spinellus fusiger]